MGPLHLRQVSLSAAPAVAQSGWLPTVRQGTVLRLYVLYLQYRFAMFLSAMLRCQGAYVCYLEERFSLWQRKVVPRILTAVFLPN